MQVGFSLLVDRFQGVRRSEAEQPLTPADLLAGADDEEEHAEPVHDLGEGGARRRPQEPAEPDEGRGGEEPGRRVLDDTVLPDEAPIARRVEEREQDDADPEDREHTEERCVPAPLVAGPHEHRGISQHALEVRHQP